MVSSVLTLDYPKEMFFMSAKTDFDENRKHKCLFCGSGHTHLEQLADHYVFVHFVAGNSWEEVLTYAKADFDAGLIF